MGRGGEWRLSPGPDPAQDQAPGGGGIFYINGPMIFFRNILLGAHDPNIFLRVNCFYKNY
jgi:hypothetical protein